MTPGGSGSRFGLLAAWRFRRHAASYVQGLWAEPNVADVEWLTSLEPNDDADHARWELRYLQRAAILLAAERDALDDRTPAVVARAIARAFEGDSAVAHDRAAVARHQFNERLASYRSVLSAREATPVTPRLGLVLLTFLGRPTAASDPLALRAGTIVQDALTRASDALRARFGTAELPEDIAPSAAMGGVKR
ncbi:MAG TPA: hypothetical protein VHM30_12085 [Gemmatimonadaceae bacterium]|nr:hypothetical protein [Gemmatimonadaceae bacterium]